MKNPIVTFETESGNIIEAELYSEITPNTVNNFINLVNRDFYNGLISHRIINGFVIRGGCPGGNRMRDPEYSIKGEFSQNGLANQLKHTEGVLSMAHVMDPSPAGSQFFIMHKNSPHLDGAYAVFGKVIEGTSVVNKITDVRADCNDRPMKGQKLKSMTVDTFGETYPESERC